MSKTLVCVCCGEVEKSSSFSNANKLHWHLAYLFSLVYIQLKASILNNKIKAAVLNCWCNTKAALMEHNINTDFCLLRLLKPKSIPSTSHLWDFYLVTREKATFLIVLYFPPIFRKSSLQKDARKSRGLPSVGTQGTGMEVCADETRSLHIMHVRREYFYMKIWSDTVYTPPPALRPGLNQPKCSGTSWCPKKRAPAYTARLSFANASCWYPLAWF